MWYNSPRRELLNYMMVNYVCFRSKYARFELNFIETQNVHSFKNINKAFKIFDMMTSRGGEFLTLLEFRLLSHQSSKRESVDMESLRGKTSCNVSGVNG